MRAAPPVAIGLPVYNGEQYLAQAIESILAQTHTDFELIVGDNASTDGTAEIAASYQAADPRVTLLTSDVNRGAAWNYNRVFHASSAELFRWGAHDDLVRPAYLERLVEALQDNPATVLAQTQTSLIDGEGVVVGEWNESFDLTGRRPSRRLRELVRHLVMSNIMFGLMRRSAMEQTRLHGAYPSADYVFLAELSLVGPFTIVPERLFLRRVHPQMSRRAHASLQDVADWFEPGSGSTARPEALRLFREHLRGIGHSPLRVDQRVGATAAFVPTALRRYWRRMARETCSLALRSIGLR
jgi:glycosyltransferase involved in cell wall biosynthesis